MTDTRHHVFTLIELSIVLVIIGLIIGGILLGRDMIEAATLRKEVSQLEQWASAVNTFKSKYNCLPGDCANAVTFGLGPAGDGDGIVETFHGAVPAEGLNAWVHLANSGLIAGNYTAGSCVAGVGEPLLKIPSSNLFNGAPVGYAMFTAD